MRLGPLAAALAAVTLPALGLAGCSSSGSSSSAAGSPQTSAGTPSTKGCPTAAAVTTAMGSTFTGPVTGTAGGTAPCVYTGPQGPQVAGPQVNVLFNAPGLSESAFTTQAHSDMGPTTAPVSGVGTAAFASTAFGHAEIEVWVSSSESFSITIETGTGAVAPDNAAQAEAVAKAIVAG